MTALWKQGEGKYSNKESKFSIDFREDHPDLFAKLSENGRLKGGKTLTEGGYEYAVKELVSKNTGKPFTLVERKKVVVTGDPIIDSLPDNEEKEAHKAVQAQGVDFKKLMDKERQERIDKAHQENLEVQTRQAVVLEQLKEINAAILEELCKISGALEMLAGHVAAVGFK